MSAYPERFEIIAPYRDDQINDALIRITNADEFPNVSRFVFPDKDPQEIRDMLLKIHTSNDFQVQFMHKAVRRVVANSSDGLTFDGFEKLHPDKRYLFITNHRDIVLDSAILQILLRENSLPRSEISFGSNLMISPFIVDFGKVNKMFTVIRGGTRHEFLENSRLLSSYIRHTITETGESIWIAQRNGRTKDGFDKTEEGLLKMLNMSGKGTFKENFCELNIVPLTISYEIEPCGLSKVNEMYISRSRTYIKQPGEDLNSILTGISQHKGRIHMSVGDILNNFLQNFDDSSCKNENIRKLTETIDRQIYQNYKLFQRNYIAYDVLNNSNEHSDLYTTDEKNLFLETIQHETETLSGDKATLREIYYRMYANPVQNKKNVINFV